MRYRILTADDDFSFGNGQNDFYRDVPEAVGQACKTRLLLWLGEWFLNTDDGTPYLEAILGKHSQAIADAAIRDRILNTEGMDNIETYTSQLDADARSLAVEATINTIYGPTQLDIENYLNF